MEDGEIIKWLLQICKAAEAEISVNRALPPEK